MSEMNWVDDIRRLKHQTQVNILGKRKTKQGWMYVWIEMGKRPIKMVDIYTHSICGRNDCICWSTIINGRLITAAVEEGGGERGRPESLVGLQIKIFLFIFFLLRLWGCDLFITLSIHGSWDSIEETKVHL